MPNTDQGLPYPAGTGLVMAGNDDIQALAEAVAPKKLRAVKGANTNRANTAAYADDPDLVINIPGAGKYLFRASLNAAAGITHGIKIQVVGTGNLASGGPGSVMAHARAFGIRQDTLASVVAADALVNTANNILPVLNNVPAFASLYVVEISGVIYATAAGAVKIQWAQSVSGANTATLGVGSAMYAEKVAA